MSHYKVAVIGGGVAGLTAAHELAERGFGVVVFEAEHDALSPPSRDFRMGPTASAGFVLNRRQPLIGGLAATQWYRIPRPIGRSAAPLPPMHRLQPATAVNLARPEDWWGKPDPGGDIRRLSEWEGRWPLLFFQPQSSKLSEFAYWRLGKILERLAKLLASARTDEYLVIAGVMSADETTRNEAEGGFDAAHLRAVAVQEAIRQDCAQYGLVVQVPDQVRRPVATFLLRYKDNDKAVAEVRVAGLGVLHANERDREPAAQRYVEIRLHDRLLPGEHGYRFFPAFYHHVFDTMRRIPLLVQEKQDPLLAELALEMYRNVQEVMRPSGRWEASARTVFDNLRSVEVHALDSGGEVPVRPMERFNTGSLRGLLAMLDMFQEHSDVPLRDIVFGQLKMIRYATSCRARRVTYEGRTWREFAEAELGGEQYRRLLDHWPQALVGLQASRADARTTGTVLMQLLLDQVRDAGYRDGTLNAPTSEAWLDPWRRYLERERGVIFVCVRVEEFEITDKKFVRLKGKACDGTTTIDYTALGLEYDYVVVATSADVTKRLGASARTYIEQKRPELLGDLERSPFIRVAGLVPDGEAYQTEAGSQDPYEHFAGVQLFLQTDFAPLRGHVYYPNSPWRLSSVSQTQFRLNRPGELEGYTGVISVVIGAFDEPGRLKGKKAWECTADEIAAEVWDQITWSLKEAPGGPPARPQYYAIDRKLEFAEGDGPLVRNWTPFMVNTADKAGAFPERAGAYEVHMGHFVFAGTYLSTFTRLVTMEAANESARHAVNAIIRHSRGRGVDAGQECAIFDPEEREPKELELLHKIDAELFARGLPHWMDILEVEPRALEALGAGGGDRESVLGALFGALESAGGLGRELLRLFRAHVLLRA